ncbi:hypothetical protein ABZ330_11370 [Streptomyces sp. NPDC006172]|uniref:hypothetical protein n=1 Tax=Streptomyces sp. NPDC006172 TaxID=3154470 RepID=UPI003406DDB9
MDTGNHLVLEYSPVAGLATALTTPAETEPAHVQHEIEFQLYGAITATKAVLPAMRKAGTGTLLYTTGAGRSIRSRPRATEGRVCWSLPAGPRFVGRVAAVSAGPVLPRGLLAGL